MSLESEHAQRLRQEYLSQTARIKWHELQVHFARGTVVVVRQGCDLIEVSVQVGLDNAQDLQRLIEVGDVAGVSEEQAKQWYEDNPEFWAVVAAPWVLVQRAGES